MVNNARHWMYLTKVYRTWNEVKSRCDNKNNDRYKHYGGRWITYDKKWEKFEWFYEDMWDRPEWKTIDRIENNWNYCKENCKENCKWATIQEQNRNKRNNVIYKWKCIAQWCDELWINRNKVYMRINKLWWKIERALELDLDKS